MATLDIFNDDAFQVTQLSQTIVDIPRIPTLLGDDNLFTEYGINTVGMAIERAGSALHLVPSAPRGGVRQPIQRGNRSLLSINATHIPQSGVVMADEVLGVRAFGSETEVETVQGLVRTKLAIMKGNLDLTLEYLRVGALKGQVIDADGSTVLWDLYQLFGMTQQVLYMDLGNASADIKAKTIAIKRAMRAKLGGKSFTGVRVYCSETWFDAYTNHAKVLAAWDKWQDGQYLRNDQSTADFVAWDVQFRIYAGGTSAGDFFSATEAYAIPLGVPRMFQTAYAPGDYMDTVNQMGLPYYASQERMAHNKGIDIESQTNPIMLNTLPEAVLKLSTAAS